MGKKYRSFLDITSFTLAQAVDPSDGITVLKGKDTLKEFGSDHEAAAEYFISKVGVKYSDTVVEFITPRVAPPHQEQIPLVV